MVERNLAMVEVGRTASTVPATTAVGISAMCAGIAQLVERNLAKVEVAGSNPVSRSNLIAFSKTGPIMYFAPADSVRL